MFVDFTICVKGPADYAVRLRMDVVPTVGSTVCFPCSVKGIDHPPGHYFEVTEVIYYPLTRKKECYEKSQNEHTDVQVILNGTREDIKFLISRENAYSYPWRKIEKRDEE